MQIRTILYQYIKTLIKHVFLLNFTYELLVRCGYLEKKITEIKSRLFSYIMIFGRILLVYYCKSPQKSQACDSIVKFLIFSIFPGEAMDLFIEKLHNNSISCF